MGNTDSSTKVEIETEMKKKELLLKHQQEMMDLELAMQLAKLEEQYFEEEELESIGSESIQERPNIIKWVEGKCPWDRSDRHSLLSAKDSNQVKIPQQREKRCFGEYKCPKCNRRWSSGNTWPNKGQQCKKCLINVLPYNMMPLESRNDSHSNVNKEPHPQHLCQKCKELGYYCRNSS